MITEKERLYQAMDLLCQALKMAGTHVQSMEIVGEAGDRQVKVVLPWKTYYADITMDSPKTALWDVLRQIPEIR